MAQQIIAMGGGGFSMEPENLALDRYIVSQVNVARPRVCFLAQASGESERYILNFYKAFTLLDCIPSHLSLFDGSAADIESFLSTQHVIYVGGGNTKSMLALWREWQLDTILRRLADSGIILAGISAGANCWFEVALSDSIPGQLIALPCLGYLKGSCSPHYDGESQRRPTFHKLLAAGEISPGFAFDDGAAGHFIDGELVQAVSSRPNAKVYRLDRVGDSVQETALATRYLVPLARSPEPSKAPSQ